MTPSTHCIDHCLNAWLRCESLFQRLSGSLSFSGKTVALLTECAAICRGTVTAMECRSPSLPGLALLCIGICLQCAEGLERYTGRHFRICARACRNCADELAQWMDREA